MELEDSIKFTYGILDYNFQVLDTEDVPVKQIIACLAILSQKVILPTSSKNHIIL